MKPVNLLKTLFILLIMVNLGCNKSGGIYEITEFSLLPLPQKIEKADGFFLLDKNTPVLFDENIPELGLVNDFLQSFIKDLYQFELSQKSEKPSIQLSIDESLSTDEAYELVVKEQGIEIKGKTARAVFYGVQTLLQMLPSEKKVFHGFKIPSVSISDEPQFKWRGLHFDVCRHFYPVEVVKKLIDVAASLKLNTFHWHLTEDQGWRIEIKKYPKLTEIGAWRNATVTTHMVEHPLKFDTTRYGGFYTQEQIKEVVEYAKTRFITIVPEIEMPGHAVAALAAYPEFSCTGGPFEVFTEWGITDEVYCAGKDETFAFLEDILSEVIELFPGEYFHIGGDECPKTRWNSCPDCQARIKNEKLKDAHELQSYFIKRIEKFLHSKGKKLIGWDEILEGGLPERAAVMSWRGEKGGIEAASHGHDVVMSPNNDCYFDHYQGKYNEPLAIGGLTTLQDVYDYQPIPKDLDEQFRKHVLGSQANVWTEYIPTSEHAEYMIFPRLCALAENLWTSENLQNYDDFIKRMDRQYQRLDLYQINYRINPPQGYEDVNKFLDDSIAVNLYNGIPSSEIRYTLDGSEPGPNSIRYEKPIMQNLSEKIILKSVTIMPNGRKSNVMTGTFEKLIFAEPITVEKLKLGIVYTYFEDTVLSAIEIKAKETKSGTAGNFKIPAGNRPKFFAVSFSGYIQIPEDDVYTFYTQSDDGSVLYINDELVVNNDGFHWYEEKSGKTALKKGLHRIKINYFQAKYGYSFGVAIQSSKMEKQAIPDKMLFYSK
jgi:hexosaminidase